MHVLRSLAVAASGLALLVLLSAAAQAEARVALVIGNESYWHVPHLKTAANDARLLADALREDGFAVTVANDLDHDGLLASMKHFAGDAAAADWAVIYFSGHSMSAEDGSTYLIPVDAEITDGRELAAQGVAEALIGAVAGAHIVSIVIIDACRRNPFLPGMITHVRLVPTGCRRLPEIATSNLAVMLATRDGSSVADGEGPNGALALALARRITQPGLALSLMIRRVRDDVVAATAGRQMPFSDYMLPAEDLFFRPGPAHSPSP
jgi:uncharacterized caspase-like protein